MKILAIDTSGQQAGAAIVDEYITIGEISLNARSGEKSWHHSEILMPGIDQLFNLTGMRMQDIDYIAYTAGPGSFTGLRIGASTAIGLAKGLGIPAVGVPTLDALAYNVLYTGTGGYVIPMMDARRGQVYAAIYEQSSIHGLSRTTDYMALPVEEVVKQIDLSPVFFLGDGADAYHNVIMASLEGTTRFRDVYGSTPEVVFLSQNLNRQRASSVGVWLFEQIRHGFKPEENDGKVDILYIRDPQAVRSLKKS